MRLGRAMGALRFRPGEFYGAGEIRRRVGGFALASLSAVGREEDIETHAHETAHFVLVLGGGYISSARGCAEVSMGPGLVFNPAGVVHRDRFLGGKGRFLALSLSAGADREASDAASLNGPARWIRDPTAIRAALGLETALRTPGLRALALEGSAWRLVASLEPSREAKGRPPAWLGAAIQMIRDTPDAELSVAAVAAFAGVHPVHLARVFRDWLGCSPGEYLRGQRLERAVAMVGRSALALAEVATDTGFVDQAHMTRTFRAAFDLTPRRLREHVSPIQDEAEREA